MSRATLAPIAGHLPDGVVLVALATPFAVGRVNCYVLPAEPVTVVNPGMLWSDSAEVLTDTLRAAGPWTTWSTSSSPAAIQPTSGPLAGLLTKPTPRCSAAVLRSPSSPWRVTERRWQTSSRGSACRSPRAGRSGPSTKVSSSSLILSILDGSASSTTASHSGPAAGPGRCTSHPVIRWGTSLCKTGTSGCCRQVTTFSPASSRTPCSSPIPRASKGVDGASSSTSRRSRALRRGSS